MKHRNKKLLVIIAGLAVSAVAVYFFARRLQGNWGDVRESFQQANYLWLIPGVGFLAALYWLRVERWRLFLAPVARVRRQSVASATCIGFMANCVLPARAGELIRPYVLHRKEHGITFGHSLATAAGLERTFDLIGLSVLMLVTWGIMGMRAADVSAAAQEADLLGDIRAKGMLLAAVAGVGLLVLVDVALFPELWRRRAQKMAQVLPARWRSSALSFVDSLTETMAIVKDPRTVAGALAFSVGLWLAQGFSTYAVARTMHVELGVEGAFLVVIAVAVAVALPQGPAFIGPFQWAAMVAASLYGVQEGAGGAFALLMWLVNVLPITLVGLAFLWYEGLSLRSLTSASEQMEREAAEGDESGGQ